MLGRAIVPIEKFRDYTMNPHHPDNRGKARAFAALGWHIGTPEETELAALAAHILLRALQPGA